MNDRHAATHELYQSATIGQPIDMSPLTNTRAGRLDRWTETAGQRTVARTAEKWDSATQHRDHDTLSHKSGHHRTTSGHQTDIIEASALLGSQKSKLLDLA